MTDNFVEMKSEGTEYFPLYFEINFSEFETNRNNNLFKVTKITILDPKPGKPMKNWKKFINREKRMKIESKGTHTIST